MHCGGAERAAFRSLGHIACRNADAKDDFFSIILLRVFLGVICCLLVCCCVFSSTVPKIRRKFCEKNLRKILQN